MPYSTSVTLTPLDGTNPDVNGVMWEISSGPGAAITEGVGDGVIVQGAGTNFMLNFAHDPNFNAISRDIGLTLQDIRGVPNPGASENGWLFRSGRLSSLPNPSPGLDLLLCQPISFRNIPSLVARPFIPLNFLPRSLPGGGTVLRYRCRCARRH